MSNSILNDDKVSKLIDEIENRPPLYNKQLKEYLNNNLKKQLWLEVYRAVLDDWDNRTNEQKDAAGREIQDKWNCLRSCFSRELRAQKNPKSRPKRRKYIFFDRLNFLLPHTKSRCMESNPLGSEAEPENYYTNDPSELEQKLFVFPDISSRPKRKNIRRTDKISSDSRLGGLLNQSGIDEDVSFALSLVPFLRRVSQDKKIDARIEILQVLRHFTNMPSLPNQVMLPTLQVMQNQSPGTDPYGFSEMINEAIVPEMQPMPPNEFSEHSTHCDDLDVKIVLSD